MGRSIARPWYRRDPDRLQKLSGRLEASRPEMELVDEGDRVMLRGELVLRHELEAVDSYDVEVVIPKDHPRDLPDIYEIGGRIPREASRHVFSDGSACIVLPDAYWWAYPGGLELPEYLDGPAAFYYAAQSVYDCGGDPWPAGEYAHREDGIIQFYIDRLNIAEGRPLHRLVQLVGRDNPPSPGSRCPCGNTVPLHACHGAVVAELRGRIPRRLRRRALEALDERQKPATRAGRPWPRS